MKVTVRDVIGRATVLAGGSGLAREVASPQVAVPELSSTGFWKDLAAAVVHVAPAQSAYLRSLPASERVRVVGMLFKPEARMHRCDLLHGEQRASERGRVRAYPRCQDREPVGSGEAPHPETDAEDQWHGVLVEVFGLGTLITGRAPSARARRPSTSFSGATNWPLMTS